MMASAIKQSGDDIFLSLVGQQPSATALLLKSWSAEERAPATVRLLATAAVQRNGTAQRLLQFCKTVAPKADCQIVSIAPGLENMQALPSATTWVGNFLKEQDRTRKLILAADPGPSFLVAAVARLLPPHTVLLHADSDCCWAFTRWDGKETWKMLKSQNLGMDALLELYGLQAAQASSGLHSSLEEAIKKLNITIPQNVSQALVFQNLPDGASLPRLELAFEARGRLYGLCVAEGNDILQQIRAIERIALSLRNLNPQISVFCPSETQRRRIRAEGLEALALTRLRGWIENACPAPPGRAVECDATGPDPLPDCVSVGGGESENPLLVWMGAEPLSTLTSIWTHRPKQVVLLYDHNTPVVVEKIRRLLECADSIPAGQIWLWPSDHLGRLVSRRIQKQFPNAKADVSPGTKAQTAVFARLPNLQLWSLRQPYAVALDGSASIPLTYPDLLTITRIHSGKLHPDSCLENARTWGQEQADFLLLLGRAIAQAPESLRLDPLPEFQTESASLTWDRNGIWHARVGTDEAEGVVPWEGGGWLEQVVAAAFVNAGAQEFYLNLKWAWPPGVLVPRDGPRAELDVAARLGPAVFAISCKLRAPNLSLRKQAAEVEAVARTHFGRFAIPVVVRVRLTPNHPPEKGAILFDLATVVSDDFRQKLDEAVRTRRTLEN